MSDSVANSKAISKIIDEIVVLDLDRTLLNTGLVTDMLLTRLLQHGVTEEQLDAMKSYVASQTGNSLDLFAWLENEVENISIDTLVEDVLHRITPDQDSILLCKGAAELIAMLELRMCVFSFLHTGSIVIRILRFICFDKL